MQKKSKILISCFGFLFLCLGLLPVLSYEAIAEICPTVYDPVCGVDGITYGNDCEAGIAGVEIAYPGECDQCIRNNMTTETFPSIQSAIDAPNALDYDIIQINSANFNEDVVFDRNIILILSGGWYCDFLDNQNTSSINSLTIKNGLAIIENIVIKDTCTSNVTLCSTSVDCTAAGGYWWSDNTCMGVSESETVMSAGGRIWMDRNLGATQVAISVDDEAAYGDLYQWGRGADGHQLRTSGITSITSSTDDPGHGDFIITSTSPLDWRVPQNDSLWQGVSGTNNPCPAGFRLATETEWETERLSWSSNDPAGAFNSPLKLVVAGHRIRGNGAVSSSVGSFGYYWSSTVARLLTFSSDEANMISATRANGLSVRCIQD